MNTIGFLAILPFYVELLLVGLVDLQFLRIMRVIRIARVLKLSRYASWLNVFGNTFIESMAPLAMVVFVMCIMMLFFSAVIYFAETPEGAESSSVTYSSIPASMWWSIVTMTTVGFGDMTPSTPLGKFVACTLSLLGIVVLAVPISVVSANFQDQFTRNERQKNVAREHRQKLLQTQENLEQRRERLLSNRNEGKSDEVQAVLTHAAATSVAQKFKERDTEMRKIERRSRSSMRDSIRGLLNDWHPTRRAQMLQHAQAILNVEKRHWETKKKQLGWTALLMGKPKGKNDHVERQLGLI